MDRNAAGTSDFIGRISAIIFEELEYRCTFSGRKLA